MNNLKELNKQKKHHASIQCVSSKNSDGMYNLGNLLEEKSQEKVANILKKHKFNINIVLLGDTGVGKTSLIKRIINDSFEINTISTIGTQKNFFKVDLIYHSSINYCYYDTSGQDLSGSSWNKFLDSIDIIIFVIDKNEIEVQSSIIEVIEERVLLSHKKIICCINKKASD